MLLQLCANSAALTLLLASISSKRFALYEVVRLILLHALCKSAAPTEPQP
jgi:hypothetical protein